MNKQVIQDKLGNIDELYERTRHFISKVASQLEDERFSDEEGNLVLDTVLAVLASHSDSPEKYLINAISLQLVGKLEQDKIEYLNGKLMEAITC